MRNRIAIVAMALAAPVLPGAAAADADSRPTADPGNGAAAARAQAPSARAARTRRVRVGDDFFRPARLKVRRRTRVRWVWRGRDRHNVTVVSGPRRFSSPTKTRGRFTKRLRARGVYRIICTVHGPSMSMRIRVR